MGVLQNLKNGLVSIKCDQYTYQNDKGPGTIFGASDSPDLFQQAASLINY